MGKRRSEPAEPVEAEIPLGKYLASTGMYPCTDTRKTCQRSGDPLTRRFCAEERGGDRFVA